MADGSSSDAARCMIYDLLADLSREQFDQFKDWLPACAVEAGEKKIPRSRLENASCMNIANTMIEYYDDRTAFKIAQNVLMKIPLMNMLDEFKTSVQRYFGKKRKLSEPDTEDHKRKYKEYVKKKFRSIKSNDSRIGEAVALEERYTKLLILKNYCKKQDKEHEILSYGERHLQLMAERAENSYSNIEDIFSPEKDGHIPRTVVLQGVSGIGKTMTARKIMFDWASGNLFQDSFEYVFYIHCRDYNQPSAEMPLTDLIIPTIEGEPLLSMSEIEDNPRKVLFIIDGFDELKITGDLLSDDADKGSPKDQTIFGLIRERYLSDSYIIITTRPTALDALEKCVKDERLAEILGFSEEDRVEYFKKFFKNEAQCARAIRIVKENEIVYTMCFVPIVCWIVCTVIKEQMEDKEDSLDDLRTMTSVYLLYLFNLLKQQSKDSLPSISTNNLKSLCALAVEGVRQQKILFQEDDLRKHNVDIPAIGLFLKESIFKERTVIFSLYSFIHLSFQEFFAALFYILEENAETAENTESPQRKVMQLLTEYRKQDNKHWMLTVRFLFGLLNTERWNKINSTFQWKVSPEIKPALQAWITEQLKQEDKLTSHKMDLFHCLYESHDDEFVKKLAECMECKYLTTRDMRREMNSMDFRALTFCFKNSDVKYVGLADSRMSPEDVIALMPLLMKCSTLWLYDCSLTDSCCNDLASVLKTNIPLTKLDLGFNELGDSGVKKLCEGLQHPNCKLQILWLQWCYLTDSCCEDLASVFETNTSLTELELTDNKLGDCGVRALCDGLKHPGCKLKKMSLCGVDLSSKCPGDLREAVLKKLSQGKLKRYRGFDCLMEASAGEYQGDCSVFDQQLPPSDSTACLPSVTCPGVQSYHPLHVTSQPLFNVSSFGGCSVLDQQLPPSVSTACFPSATCTGVQSYHPLNVTSPPSCDVSSSGDFSVFDQQLPPSDSMAYLPSVTCPGVQSYHPLHVTSPPLFNASSFGDCSVFDQQLSPYVSTACLPSVTSPQVQSYRPLHLTSPPSLSVSSYGDSSVLDQQLPPSVSTACFPSATCTGVQSYRPLNVISPPSCDVSSSGDCSLFEQQLTPSTSTASLPSVTCPGIQSNRPLHLASPPSFDVSSFGACLLFDQQLTPSISTACLPSVTRPFLQSNQPLHVASPSSFDVPSFGSSEDSD